MLAGSVFVLSVPRRTVLCKSPGILATAWLLKPHTASVTWGPWEIPTLPEKICPRVCTLAFLSAFPSTAPLPWPWEALSQRVKSAQGCPGDQHKEERGGEGRISRERGGPVRSCDRLGLLVPPRWQCQGAVLEYLARLRSKHPIQTGPSVSLNRLCK